MNTELTTAWQAILTALAQFAQTLLMVALPILAAFAVDWLRVQIAAARAKLLASGHESTLRLLETLASFAVRAAEQELGGDAGAQKKAYAVKLVSDWLETRGVQLDEAAILAAVEAAVWSELNAPATTLRVEAPQG